MTSKVKEKRIDIFMHSYENIYGNYYMPGNAHLDMQLADHIILQASDQRSKENLEICIWRKEDDEDEDDKFENALKNTFTDMIAEVKKESRINTIVATIAMLIGVLAAFASRFILVSSPEVYFVIVIAVWVFIWYAVESYFFDNLKLRFRTQQYKKIINAKILFERIQAG